MLLICQPFLLTVFAADDSVGSPTVGAIRQADPSTMDTYQNILDFSENTRYAGRFWSDKSVYAYDYDNGDEDWNNNTLTLNKKDDGLNGKISLDADFLHVFSAMGSSLSLSTQNIRPLDVVLLLDISTSMTNQNLGNDDSLHQMLNDANNLIATLMNNAVEQGGQADPSIHKTTELALCFTAAVRKLLWT